MYKVILPSLFASVILFLVGCETLMQEIPGMDKLPIPVNTLWYNSAKLLVASRFGNDVADAMFTNDDRYFRNADLIQSYRFTARMAEESSLRFFNSGKIVAEVMVAKNLAAREYLEAFEQISADRNTLSSISGAETVMDGIGTGSKKLNERLKETLKEDFELDPESKRKLGEAYNVYTAGLIYQAQASLAVKAFSEKMNMPALQATAQNMMQRGSSISEEEIRNTPIKLVKLFQNTLNVVSLFITLQKTGNVTGIQKSAEALVPSDIRSVEENRVALIAQQLGIGLSPSSTTADIPASDRTPDQTPPVVTNSSPENGQNLVFQAQRLLTHLGYQPGPVDGAMGRKTREAIIAFQRDQRLPRTGQVTPELIHQLEERR